MVDQVYAPREARRLFVERSTGITIDLRIPVHRIPA